jgi:hypothetical protein
MALAHLPASPMVVTLPAEIDAANAEPAAADELLEAVGDALAVLGRHWAPEPDSAGACWQPMGSG